MGKSIVGLFQADFDEVILDGMIKVKFCLIFKTRDSSGRQVLMF